METNKYTILVNGTGNIGTTLLNLLVNYQSELNVGKIYACKRSLHPWNKTELDILRDKGVLICTTNQQVEESFWEDVLDEVDYIFEATANGIGLSNLERYKQLKRLKGASAQGSEKGFGIPFMSGINDAKIKGVKFVNIVSCNTHGTAALLKAFAGDKLENLAEADMVVVRRSEDLGNHQRLVSANVVARHLSETVGTHHSIDVIDMFKTIDVTCNLTSSDITTPSQLMHSVRFNIQLKSSLNQSVDEVIQANLFLAKTKKFDSNVVFELGRRYGFNGRIFSHAIVLTENVLQTDNTIKGWAFVPQEGNSILSTIHAYILQMEFKNGLAVFEKISAELLRKEW